MLARAGLVALVAALASGALAQDVGTLNPKPLPPLAHPEDPKLAGERSFRTRAEPDRTQGALDRILRARMSGGGEGAASGR